MAHYLLCLIIDMTYRQPIITANSPPLETTEAFLSTWISYLGSGGRIEGKEAVALRKLTAETIPSSHHPHFQSELHALASLLREELVGQNDNGRRIWLLRPLAGARSLPNYQLVPYDISNLLLSIPVQKNKKGIIRYTMPDLIRRVFQREPHNPKAIASFYSHVADLISLGYMDYKPSIPQSPGEYFYIKRPEERMEIREANQVPQPETANQLNARIRQSIGGTAALPAVHSTNHRTHGKNGQQHRR